MRTAKLFAGLVAMMIAAMPGIGLGATIGVTTQADVISADGLCSLREAVIAANTNSAFMGCDSGQAGPGVVDVIRVPRGVYVLTITGVEDGTETGDATVNDLDVTDDVHLKGAGKYRTVIDADGIDRVFHVPRVALALTLSDLKIRNGDASPFGGGGIFYQAPDPASGSTLTVKRSVIANNQAGEIGGGIAVENADGSEPVVVSVWRSVVSGNDAGVAGSSGGGIGATAVNGPVTLEVSKSKIVHNAAHGTGSGGGIRNSGGTTTVTKSEVSHNTVDGVASVNRSGGGIRDSGTTIDVSHSSVRHNRVEGTDTASSSGGGVRNSGGTTTIKGSSIMHNLVKAVNSAGSSAGGVRNSGSTITITKSTIAHNKLDSAEVGDSGGGIRGAGTLIVVNSSSVVKNQVVGSCTTGCEDIGGGIRNDYEDNGMTTVRKSVITKNKAPATNRSAGAIHMTVEEGSGTDMLTVEKTLIQGNRSETGGIYIGGTLPASGTITNSDIVANVASGDGGGITNGSSTELTLTGTPVLKNRAGGSGGGIFNQGMLTLVDSPVVGNVPDNCVNDSGGTGC